MMSKVRDNSGDDLKLANPAVFQLGHEPALDGLRGIAILSVMAFNTGMIFKESFFSMQGGFLGVDIFFVLSGFLITLLLVQGYDRTSGIGIKNFYLRRALRLFPALFAMILFIVAYALFFQTKESAVSTLKGVLYTLFYVANWAQISPGFPGIGALNHAWSLSVEEQFYIFWPILLLVLLRIKKKAVIFAILTSLSVISILISFWLWHTGASYLRIYLGSDTRAHELLIGCIAALMVSRGVFRRTTRLKWSFHAAAVISFAGILLSFILVRHDAAFVYNGGFALISIGTAALILDFLLFPSKFSRFFEFAPLVWFGKISYGLYLWHIPIFLVTLRLGGRTAPFYYEVIGVGATVLVATASYYLLEKPFLRLKSRFKSAGASGSVLMHRSRAAESA